MIRSISAQDLSQLAADGWRDPGFPGGMVRVFDLRAEDRFSAGHIVGARHLPVEAVLRWVPQAAHTQEMVILIDDRGAVDGAARQAAAELSHSWFRRLRYLEGGMEAWKTERRTLLTGGPTGLGSAAFEGRHKDFQRSVAISWNVPPATALSRSI